MSKICIQCGGVVPAGKRGRNPACSEKCSSDRAKESKRQWSINNREKKNAIGRAEYYRNHEKRLRRAKERRAANLDEKLEYERKYREANRERIYMQGRIWAINNPDKARRSWQKSNARMRAAVAMVKELGLETELKRAAQREASYGD